MNNNNRFYEGLENSNNIFAELADFDIKYAKYIYCNDSTKTAEQKASCTEMDMSASTVTNAYKKLISDGENGANLNNFKKVITNLKKDYGNNISETEYKAKYDGMYLKYQNVLTLRRSLDDKMRMLYDVDNKLTYDNKLKYNATVYSGIIWTVLASSLVYYMFSKL